MESCRKSNDGKDADRCDTNERRRLETNLMQPRSMVNYTESGFEKIRTPAPLMKLLTAFYESNLGKEKLEPKSAANVFTNSYDAPSYLLDVTQPRYEGGGPELKQQLWDAARATIQEWTGQRLKPSSLYGIRIYREGAVLAPHVDRLPLISSAIINVAQDVEEDWPLEVIAHGDEGRAVNVTMKPGDFVLYESHSVIHGRPFPLKGKYYANIFIHFVPEEEDEDGDLPPYILPGSPAAQDYYARLGATVKRPDAHVAADLGDISALRSLLSRQTSNYANFDSNPLNEPDYNGWRPLHEAARSGRTEAVEFLLDHGAYVNARTGHKGEGSTALRLVVEKFGREYELARLLVERGGVDLGQGRLERDSNGATELHRAADRGDLLLVQTILPPAFPHIADEVDTADANGWRPLHEAARGGHVEVVRFLLEERGADVNVRTTVMGGGLGSGKTPLHYAVQFRGADHPVAKLLRSWGAVD